MAAPGVNTGSNTLRARPLKRPPKKGHSADRFASDRWKSKLQIFLASVSRLPHRYGAQPGRLSNPDGLPPGHRALVPAHTAFY